MEEINYDKLPDRSILCVDMKAFYASVEAVERGLDPLSVYLAVIGNRKRKGSVILAASPALKHKYGLGTGNRYYELPEREEIMVVEARMGLYLERSMEITEVYNDFVPLDALHVYSIDEAWLKLQGTELLFGPPRETAEKIKKRLWEEFGLPCSMGLGPNMFLAKVAMDIEGKQEGLAEWRYADVREKLWPVPVGDCWGIGRRLEHRFRCIGVETVGELACLGREYLEGKFGVMGSQLYYHAHGVDLSRVEGHYQDCPRSVGRGITLLRDYKRKEEIETVVFELSEEVARRAREQNLAGRTVNLGLGYSRAEKKGGFHRQLTREQPTNLACEIYELCLQLLEEYHRGETVRKVNVSLSNLTAAAGRQLNLFKEQHGREQRLARVRDRLQERFSHKALFYGRSLKEESIRDRIRITIGGHKA
ncbi:MAG: UV damage repair protein UvrX [Halanaerobiaceae bacterium]